MTNEQIEKELKKLKRRICCNTGGGSGDPLTTQDSNSITFSGDGSLLTPLSANVSRSSTPSQGLIEYGDGLYTPNLIRNGLVSGGIVTWLGTGFDYNVSPAVYYINGVLYNSPSTDITLDPSDVTNNRIDVFVLTTSSTADKVTGTPAVSPEKPATNSATQLEISFVLVFANTTTPFPVQDYIYREGAEWTPSFNSANIVQTSNFPLNGTSVIEGTNVVSGNNVIFTRGSVTTTSNFTALILNIRSKATWGTNRTLTLRFRNGLTNVANVVTITRVSSYGFDSSTTGLYQRVVIPILDFGLIPNDLIDNLVITASGSGGTQGFYIDDIEFQGGAASVVSSNPGTTDNVGVFYVSKNYSGIGAAFYDNGIFSATTSTNAGFTAQLNAARMGDPNKAYPDPWAAAKAASQAISNGQITRALVVVNGGNLWTYGSGNSANNGDALGNSATPTIADIGLITGNSLMRDKIDFYFHPNSTLINICRTSQILIGLNTSTSNTKWVSGIYGHGTFIAIYGTNNGLSQRMFQIGNGNGEMTIECDTIIAQRAWFFVTGGEAPALLKLKAKKVITDGTGSLLFGTQSLPLATEVTAQSNIIIDVDTVYRGQKYFPYPSSAQVSSGDNTRQLVEFNSNTAVASTRQKSLTINLKQCYIHDTGAWLFRTGNTTNQEANTTIDMNIGYLKHENNLTKTGNLIRGGIQLSTNISSGARINTHYNIFINDAQVEEALLSATNFTSLNASSLNNTFNLKIGTIQKTGAYAGTTGLYIFAIPSTSAGAAGQPMRGIIDVGYAQSDLGNVFKMEELLSQGNTTYRDKWIVRGTYKNTAANPVINSTLSTFGNTGVTLDNATLVTAGTQSITSTNAGDIYYSKDSYSNVAVNLANVTVQGLYNVDADLTNFI